MGDGDEDGDVKQYPNEDGDGDEDGECKTRIRMSLRYHNAVGSGVNAVADVMVPAIEIERQRWTIHTTLGDGVARIKRHRRNLSGDGVRKMTMASGRDANPIRTLGDYSKPSRKGYRNTIELLVGNSEVLFDPTPFGWCKTNAHFTDIGPRIQSNTLRKLVDSLDLDGENWEKNAAPKKVLIKEEAKSPVTKNINSISLARGKKERNDNDYMADDGGINETDREMPVKEAEKETKAKNGTKNIPIKRSEREETTEASSSQPVIFKEKKLEISKEDSLEDSWRMI
nr:hypothetical protein [Tanacetum cinerariifolium]